MWSRNDLLRVVPFRCLDYAIVEYVPWGASQLEHTRACPNAEAGAVIVFDGHHELQQSACFLQSHSVRSPCLVVEFPRIRMAIP